MTKQGKFIVVEGTDGSGKKTQLDLLRRNLRKAGQGYEVLDFPRYYSNFWGALIGRFLSGEFGDLDEVSPYLVAPYYALDQAGSRKDIIRWKKEGKFILSNRYISSSLAHQTAKLPEEEQESFVKWLLEAGYKWLQMVKEDLVIFLYIPAEISFRLARDAKARNRKKYIENGREIAEENFDHQSKAAEMYLHLTERFEHWKLVNCVDSKNRLRSKRDIQAEILRLLRDEELYDGQLVFDPFNAI